MIFKKIMKNYLIHSFLNKKKRGRHYDATTATSQLIQRSGALAAPLVHCAREEGKGEACGKVVLPQRVPVADWRG